MVFFLPIALHSETGCMCMLNSFPSYIFLYVRRTVIWYRNKLCYFLLLSWFFLGFSHPLKNEMNRLICLLFCHSGILWPFHVCNAKGVIISMSKYLPISPKFGTNIPQCNNSGWLIFSSCKFLLFLLTFFSFLGLSQVF